MDSLNQSIPMDLIFSYWVYLWFVIYELVSFSSSKTKANQYILKYWNPLLALIFALIENVAMLIHLLYIWPSTTIVVKYIGMMILIKVWPIYQLRNTKIEWKHDILNLSLIFLVYNLYLLVNNTNVIEVYEKTYNSIANDRNETPIFYTINRIMKWIYEKTGYDFGNKIREKVDNKLRDVVPSRYLS